MTPASNRPLLPASHSRICNRRGGLVSRRPTTVVRCPMLWGVNRRGWCIADVVPDAEQPPPVRMGAAPIRGLVVRSDDRALAADAAYDRRPEHSCCCDDAGT